MPIYEYKCRVCDHYLDVLQKLSDSPLKFCPECGEGELRKLVSAPQFRLKGSGWYETDFKQDKRRNLADGGKPEGGAGAKTEGATGAKGEGGKGKTGAKAEGEKGKSDSRVDKPKKSDSGKAAGG